MTQAELAALRSYAAEHGRFWKAALSRDWSHARAVGERGAILHSLRNTHGPQWLANFQLPKGE